VRADERTSLRRNTQSVFLYWPESKRGAASAPRVWLIFAGHRFVVHPFRISSIKNQLRRCAMKRALRVKSVGTKVSEAEYRLLESRAEASGQTLSEWVRNMLLGSSVDGGTMAMERALSLCAHHCCLQT